MLINENDLLEELFSLLQDAKVIDKRIEELKAYCKDKGSFYTKDYVCAVNGRSRMSMVGVEEAIAKLGKEFLMGHNMIRSHNFLAVTVAKKELGQAIGS